ncbi:hypothetical protein B0H63DRAFT_523081 [Podospora didyma]|uniref:Uncharacterized protein n=1 Tax=Podospora didyma TaxID=330526 RepID=A0AAE0U066_9PEZI|nr:hypothetical protein B0H63DRAFT_523081 [Podospora didyma]
MFSQLALALGLFSTLGYTLAVRAPVNGTDPVYRLAVRGGPVVNETSPTYRRTARGLSVNETLPVGGVDAVVERRQVSSKDVLFGPASFCLGLSPGGSTCIQIPAGCFIVRPSDNTIPTPVCNSAKTEDAPVEKI